MSKAKKLPAFRGTNKPQPFVREKIPFFRLSTLWLSMAFGDIFGPERKRLAQHHINEWRAVLVAQQRSSDAKAV